MNDFDTFTNGEDRGKLIVAKCFKKLPKIQNIAQSGHTDHGTCACILVWKCKLSYENDSQRHSDQKLEYCENALLVIKV